MHVHGTSGLLFSVDLIICVLPMFRGQNMLRGVECYIPGRVIWGTEGGIQGNNVIMGWAIVINEVVNPYHVRDHK